MLHKELFFFLQEGDVYLRRKELPQRMRYRDESIATSIRENRKKICRHGLSMKNDRTCRYSVPPTILLLWKIRHAEVKERESSISTNMGMCYGQKMKLYRLWHSNPVVLHLLQRMMNECQRHIISYRRHNDATNTPVVRKHRVGVALHSYPPSSPHSLLLFV